MSELHKIRCLGCEGGLPVLTHEEILKYLSETRDWKVNENHKFIFKHYMFTDFYQTMAFVNAIAWIAHQEGHHPDLEVGFNYCRVKYKTHAVNGITKNDFICAVKIDRLDK
jgi:4a-hydroxytetrahydrobiopterin dehydratase